MHTEIQKALLPNPTTIVHWKKNHLGAKRQLFSHIGRKINWISNSFSRTYYYPTTTVFYTSQSTIRDKKGHHTNTPLSPFRRPVFFSYFIADCILYWDTISPHPKALLYGVSHIFPLSSAITFWDPHLGGRGPCKQLPLLSIWPKRSFWRAEQKKWKP